MQSRAGTTGRGTTGGPGLFATAPRAGKAVPDPSGILDPGVVIDLLRRHDGTEPARPPDSGPCYYQPTATSSHCGLPWETKED
ncbi:hypothetical protein [Streptomyces sp. LN245]|uniref:hypothetical protein n=1 Tax=Streptomyces sp. LN245 TaxID=3112975 RepID=UPI00371DACD5